MSSTLAPPKAKTRRVALIGNPNTGKTTVFNVLTGYRARVGNYAGVTVERKIGPLKGSGGAVELIDLPGTYSLSARSADEMVAVDVLLGHRTEDPRPDLVLIVLDASNLERNLFLATQVVEAGLPCALILNMIDVAEANRVEIDTKLLEKRTGLPVFPTVGAKEKGFDAVRSFITGSDGHPVPDALVDFPGPFVAETDKLAQALRTAGCPEEHATHFLIRRALLEQGGMAEQRIARFGGAEAARLLAEAKQRLLDQGLRLFTLEAKTRYSFIRTALDGVMKRPETHTATISDKIDEILIHKVWGTLIFVALMLVIFQAIYAWSAPFMDLIDGAFSGIGDLIGANMADGPLKSFLIDGVVAGVGGVVIFLPQILVLFFFISILEDCGYMARAAFLMDRLLSKIGLSGRSFIPMLSSFACAVPGIMATRTIEDRRDRITTILVAPLMSCSARLPVYVLLIGAFIPAYEVLGFLDLQGIVLFAMYLVGLAVAIPVALVLKKTFLKGAAPAFIMELPPYRMPSWKNVGHRLLDRAGAFLKRAGTVIFAVAILVWALGYYPRPESVETEVREAHAAQLADLEAQAGAAAGEEAELAEENLAALQEEIDREVQGAYVRQSFLGRMGRVVEPVVSPLGWDWKIGMAAIASFPARELIVSTLGVIYDLGNETDEGSADLREKLQAAKRADGSPAFSIAVALSIMVFFALCAQCAATLAVMKRETNSWRWPLFAFGYMTVLAYFGAMITYHVASGVFGL